MILIPGSLYFAKLVMSSAPAKSVGDARYMCQDPFMQEHTSKTDWRRDCMGQSINLIDCPIQSRLQSVLEVCSFYVKCSYLANLSPVSFLHFKGQTKFDFTWVIK